MRNKVAISGLARMGYEGRNWYNDARKEIDYVCNAEKWNSSYFSGIIAVTSPRCSVRRNIRLALHWMKEQALPTGTMKMTHQAAIKWRDCNEISGPKVSAFCGKDSIRKKELATAESILREVAVELGLTPAPVSGLHMGRLALFGGLESYQFSDL